MEIDSETTSHADICTKKKAILERACQPVCGQNATKDGNDEFDWITARETTTKKR
jgi:hypothetical protein